MGGHIERYLGSLMRRGRRSKSLNRAHSSVVSSLTLTFFGGSNEATVKSAKAERINGIHQAVHRQALD